MRFTCSRLLGRRRRVTLVLLSLCLVAGGVLPRALAGPSVSFDGSRTNVTCAPSPVDVGTAIGCTATVVDAKYPWFSASGAVTFSSAGGTFSPALCPTPSPCRTTFTPTTPGSAVVSAAYSGGAWPTCFGCDNQVAEPIIWSPSSASTSIAVTSRAVTSTGVSLQCAPGAATDVSTSYLDTKGEMTCSVSVTNLSDGSAVNGTVAFWDGGCGALCTPDDGYLTFPHGATCTGTPCDVTVGTSMGSDTHAWGGPETLGATYLGDPSYASSSATTVVTELGVSRLCPYPLIICGF